VLRPLQTQGHNLFSPLTFALHVPLDAQRHLISRPFFRQLLHRKRRFSQCYRVSRENRKSLSGQWQSKSQIRHVAESTRALAAQVHELSTLLPIRMMQLTPKQDTWRIPYNRPHHVHSPNCQNWVTFDVEIQHFDLCRAPTFAWLLMNGRGLTHRSKQSEFFAQCKSKRSRYADCQMLPAGRQSFVISTCDFVE